MTKKIVFAAALLAGAVACNNAEYGPLGQYAYINESVSTLVHSQKVVIDGENGATTELTVSLSRKAEKETHFHLEIDPSLLEQYNESQSASYVVMPEQLYELPSDVAVASGKFSADPITVRIKPIPKELLGESYAIPVRLVSSDGSVPTTGPTSGLVITTENIVDLTLPMFEGASGIKTVEGFPMNLPQFTVEVRFQVSDTADRNRSVFTNGSSGNGLVLLRFEDPQSDQGETKAHSLVQFQGGAGFLNPTHAFGVNKWQHLAVTYDGTKVTLYVNGQPAGVRNLPVTGEFVGAGWFGGAVGSGGDHGVNDEKWWRGCKILMTEARIWSVCRTEAQIQNNMYSVSPSSKGLEAYWRFNEGEGQTFKDCTGNGHDCTTDKQPRWVSGIKSNATATEWPE